MEGKNLDRIVKNITMPGRMADELLNNCTGAKPAKSRLLRRSRLTAAAIMAVLLTGIGATTSSAAYNLYQIKNVDVFFETDITGEQLAAIGEELNNMPGIYSVRYVSADEAWEAFRENCLEGMENQFPDNPLQDSSSYRVVIKLDADTAQIRSQIQQLEGVRKVSDLREAKSGELTQ